MDLKFLENPPTLLITAGLVFLLLSVATIKRPIVIDITSNGRKIAGVIGGLLLIIGIILMLLPLSMAGTKDNSVHLDILRIREYFENPKDVPDYIKIPSKPKLEGKINPAPAGNLKTHVWVAICPLDSEKCAVKNLKLTSSGEWNEYLLIGGPEDACKRFLLTFVLVDEKTNDLLNAREESGMSNAEFTKLEFTTWENLQVERSLDDETLLEITSCSLAQKGAP